MLFEFLPTNTTYIFRQVTIPHRPIHDIGDQTFAYLTSTENFGNIFKHAFNSQYM